MRPSAIRLGEIAKNIKPVKLSFVVIVPSKSNSARFGKSPSSTGSVKIFVSEPIDRLGTNTPTHFELTPSPNWVSNAPTRFVLNATAQLGANAPTQLGSEGLESSQSGFPFVDLCE